LGFIIGFLTFHQQNLKGDIKMNLSFSRNSGQNHKTMMRLQSFIILFVAMTFFFGIANASEKKDYAKPADLVSEAVTTFKDFGADPNMAGFREHVKKAKAVLVVPRLIKAGFIIGGSGGSGALLARDEKTGKWSYPAFYTMGSGSIGLQIGGAADQVVLLVMTKKGMDSLLSSSFKLGADASVAAGPVGQGAKAVTADILAYSRSKGIFGGVSVEGSVISVRDKWNEAYYGKSVRPTDMIILHNVTNTQADPLRMEVSKVAGK
jgi:lipid-binding SYLF domain-containing protein